METILTFIGWTESSDGVEKLEHIIEDFGYGDILIEDYDTYKVLFFNKDQMASIATEKEAVIFSGIYSMLLLWIGKSVFYDNNSITLSNYPENIQIVFKIKQLSAKDVNLATIYFWVFYRKVDKLYTLSWNLIFS